MRCCTSDGGAGIEGGWTADLRGTWENTPEGYREGPDRSENKGDPVPIACQVVSRECHMTAP